MAINICKKFGERVKEIRSRSKLSQERLAADANINRSYMAEIETGKANPTIKKVYKISRALKVSPMELFRF